MGSLCSKPSTHTGGHTVLGASHQAGDYGSNSQSHSTDTRGAAAAAAERRLKAERERGTNAANPKRGRLAAQVQASKAAPRLPEQRAEEQLVWD